jgi:hypothetical protein
LLVCPSKLRGSALAIITINYSFWYYKLLEYAKKNKSKIIREDLREHKKIAGQVGLIALSVRAG